MQNTNEIGLEVARLLEVAKQMDVKVCNPKKCVLYAEYNNREIRTTLTEFVWNYIKQPRNAGDVAPIFYEGLRAAKNQPYLFNFFGMLLRKDEKELIREYLIVARNFQSIVWTGTVYKFLANFEDNDCIQNLIGFQMRKSYMPEDFFSCKDYKKWYKRSAKQGNSCGLYNLSRLIPENSKKVKLLKESAKKGNPIALENLYLIYKNDSHGNAKAMKYLKRMKANRL